MKILLVSPYHGGSHQAWAEGYGRYSAHTVQLLTLPARFWKWRMHGGAITLSRRYLEQPVAADLILATDMLDLTTFLALTRAHTHATPTAVYMHENQLTYPLPQDGRTGPMRRQLGERDQHYAFVNFASMLAADRVLFNSAYHRDVFFAALPRFLKHFPEYNELNSIARLKEKSETLPVGVDFARLAPPRASQSPAGAPPLVLWNQRWEYDKNPAAFFRALYTLAAEGVAFRVALCGQQYGRQPRAFARAQEQLSARIIHVGYANDELYRRLLWQAAVTVSTAHHEFFGISVVEAIGCRTFPVLPRRLSYPELLPADWHAACLYDDEEGLRTRLRWALTHPQEARETAAALATAVRRFDWHEIAPRYDARLAWLCQQAS